MDQPPPSYPFGLPVGVNRTEWERQWREWERRRSIVARQRAEAQAQLAAAYIYRARAQKLCAPLDGEAEYNARQEAADREIAAAMARGGAAPQD